MGLKNGARIKLKKIIFMFITKKARKVIFTLCTISGRILYNTRKYLMSKKLILSSMNQKFIWNTVNVMMSHVT